MASLNSFVDNKPMQGGTQMKGKNAKAVIWIPVGILLFIGLIFGGFSEITSEIKGFKLSYLFLFIIILKY